MIHIHLNFGSPKLEVVRHVLTDEHRMPSPIWNPTTDYPNLLCPESTLAFRQAVWNFYQELGNGYGYRVFVPVATASLGQSEWNKVRFLLRLHGLQLGMIANFANKKVEIKYIKG